MMPGVVSTKVAFAILVVETPPVLVAAKVEIAGVIFVVVDGEVVAAVVGLIEVVVELIVTAMIVVVLVV